MKRMMTAFALGALMSGGAQARLIDRGGGLLYDDVLNVTWLQDANYAKTSRFDSDGDLTWANAKAWAANLTYSDPVRKKTYDDWRLPSEAPRTGYNITTPDSELAYMYYINLGLTGQFSATGVFQPNYGVQARGTRNSDNTYNVGLVKNLQSRAYWSGESFSSSPQLQAWGFAFNVGLQGHDLQSTQLAAWAVRDGDVPPVPEPETYAMMAAGLGLLGFVARRRKSA